MTGNTTYEPKPIGSVPMRYETQAEVDDRRERVDSEPDYTWQAYTLADDELTD